MIDITGIEIEKKDRANTLVINPRWSFKTQSSVTNTSIDKQWSVEELGALNLNLYGHPSSLVFLWMTPTALATGKHLSVCELWKRKPQTVGVWINSTPKGSGKASFSDDCYYIVQCSTTSRFNKVDGDAPLTERYIEGPSCGTGLSYGAEVFKWLSTVGNPPHCQIFGRNNQMQHVPKDWMFVEPSRPILSDDTDDEEQS